MPDSRQALALVRAPVNPLAILQGLVDESRWVALGWDPASQILTPDIDHPTLGHSTCQAEGCWLETRGRSGLCDGCQRAWSRSTATDLEAFKAAGVQRQRRPATSRRGLCRVCCVPGHERASRSRGLCLECAKRARLRDQTVEEFVAGDSRFPPATPRRGYGRCRAASCPAWADTAARLCLGHRKRWRLAGGPAGAAFDRWCGIEPSSRDGRTLSYNLRGINERVRLEILYGLQVAIDEGRNARGSAVARTVDFLRENDAGSVLELADHEYTRAKHLGAVFLRFTIARVQTAVADPDLEVVKDVWNLRVFGYPGALDFSALIQPWLRETAKQWALAMLSRPWAANGRVGERISALAVLSTSLASRPDGGTDRRSLGRVDIVAFTNRVAHLSVAGTLSRDQHARVIALVARFLRQCREQGLGRKGGPMSGLPDDFALGRRDRVPRPTGDKEGKALPEAVMDQLLSDESLQLLEDRSGPDWRAVVELQASVGRRTAEVCELRWGCLDYDERTDEDGIVRRSPVLVHDMPKVAVVGCRLPITEADAAVILSQQQRSALRYPTTPTNELVLFPARSKNPAGKKAVNPNAFARVLRTWVRALPRLDSPERDASGQAQPFPRGQIRPYAFRHSFAQRHADAGTLVDVLKELMGHSAITSTQGYYRVTARRRRAAVDAMAALQIDHRGRQVRPAVERLLDSEAMRDQVGQVAVAFGQCTEPSNVRARGRACPFRFQCLGCSHFRTDPSYQPDLRGHLIALLKDRERLASAVPGLEEWARSDALPSEEEIEALRRLIGRNDELIAGLEPQERSVVEDALKVMRTSRAQMQTAVPVQLLGVNRQPAPTVFPGTPPHERDPTRG